jgi:hypothetical protein
MIKAKPSDAFKMVLTFDPALDEDGQGAIRQYAQDRDLSHFSVDFERGVHKKTGEKISVITAYPLRSSAFNLLDFGTDGFRQIVKTHVIKAINIAGHDVVTSKDGELPESILDAFDAETMNEIASVIVDKGRGADGVERAFFSEATSSLRRANSVALRARTARLVNAISTQNTSRSD